MPSSTSSSDSADSDLADSNLSSPDLPKSKQALRVALLTLIAGTLLFGAVIGAYNLIIIGLKSIGADLNGRVVAFIDYLPEVTAEPADKQLVMFFGSSMVQAGFEPNVFDAAMQTKGIHSVSYNYGVGNLNPYFQEIVARRIREQFEASGRKIDLALIEFNPFQTTVVRKNAIRFTDEQNVAILSSPRELLQETLRSPTRGIRMLTIRYLRQGFSAELFSSLPLFLAQTAGDGTEPTAAERDASQESQQLSAAFNQQLAKERNDEPVLPWNTATRGGRINKSQYSEETLLALRDYAASRRHPYIMQQDLQRRIDTADILELNFDEELIQAFITTVEHFQIVSDEVVVLLLPRNTDWVTYTPEAQAQLDAAGQRIQEETGVEVRDYQVIDEIGPEHFIDTTHLSSYDGIDIFTEFLADEFADKLAE